MEASIPWADLGVDGPPDTMGFDARRKPEWRQAEAVFTPAFFASDLTRLCSIQLE